MTDHRHSSDEAALRSAVEARAEALAAGDPVVLGALLHAHFRWTTHRGEVFDRDGYLAANTAGTLAWKRQDVNDLTITVVGAAGVVAGIVVDEVERSGVAETYRMPVTMTWVRSGGAWRCLAGHAGPRLR